MGGGQVKIVANVIGEKFDRLLVAFDGFAELFLLFLDVPHESIAHVIAGIGLNGLLHIKKSVLPPLTDRI